MTDSIGQRDGTGDDAAGAMLDALRRRLQAAGSVLVAYSGGVDSTFLAAVAQEVLGERAAALTAVSPAMPARDLEDARTLAARIGICHVVVESSELEDPRYSSNPPNRCFFCKSETFRLCREIATQMGLEVVADGFTVDDLCDVRPGRDAAIEQHIWSPLAEVGLGKAAIRDLARTVYGLPVWDKPASPCLASRFPYGTEITRDRLARVEAVETAARNAGLAIVRARFHDDLVRIEVPAGSAAAVAAEPLRTVLVKAAREAGFRYVTVDLEPFRSGRQNDP